MNDFISMHLAFSSLTVILFFFRRFIRQHFCVTKYLTASENRAQFQLSNKFGMVFFLYLFCLMEFKCFSRLKADFDLVCRVRSMNRLGMNLIQGSISLQSILITLINWLFWEFIYEYQTTIPRIREISFVASAWFYRLIDKHP